MESLAYRITAVVFIVVGATGFGYLMQVAYGATIDWDRKLLAIGMPLSLLLPALAALMVAIGCAMLAHAWRSAHRAR